MKILKILMLILSLSPSLFAKKGESDNEADYIVPTTPEFVSYSRFKVKIVDRFKGPQTEKISYIFPEFLIGEADKVLTLNKVPGTENTWTGSEVNASCTLTGEDFSCNIYIDSANTLISAERAINNLPALGLSPEDVTGLTGVIRSFYTHEPAGFLSYDID